MKNYYFDFRKTWIFTPTVQIVLIVFFILAISVLARVSFESTNKIFGYYPVYYRWEVTFGPIYEEIIFRGFIFGAMLKRLTLKKAIIYSSLLFGLFHLKNTMFFNYRDLISQILLAGIVSGPVWAYLTYKTKSIWLSTILHYATNFVTFLVVFLNSR